MSMTRRQFVAGVGGLAALLALAGCDKGQESGDAPLWSATQDDSLPVLTFEASPGNDVALPGEGWATRDGYIQLQLAGGSIPGQKIERVAEKDGELTVTLETGDGPSTMDLLLTEWRLEVREGSVNAIERVTVDHGGGDVRELERCD